MASLNTKLASAPNTTQNYVLKATSSTTIGNSLIYDNGTNVGINTTSPYAIAGTNMTMENATDVAFTLGVGGTRTGQFYASASEVRLGAVANVYLRFYTNDTERMRITNSGDVGINSSNTYGWRTRIVASSTTGSSNGMQIIAGTNSSDGAFSVRNYADNANYLYVRGDGNVGIGTSSPVSTLHVVGESRVYTGSNLSYWGVDNVNTYAYLGTNSAGFALSLQTGGTERMRITTGGLVLIGMTSPNAGFQLQVNQAAYFKQCLGFGTSTDDRYIGQGNQISGAFQSYDLTIANYASSGRVTITNSSTGVYLPNGSTSWATFSDEKLKNINGTIQNAVDKLSTIRAVNYSWKSDSTNKENLGLIAQDVEKVFPQVIDKSKSFENNDDETEYLSVRYTELIPVLVKAIQEQNQLINELKADIEILKSK